MNEMYKIQVLVVDDQPDVCRGLKRLIGSLGCAVTTAASAESALHQFKKKSFDLVLTDLKMEKMNGLDLLYQIKNLRPETEVVLITGHGTIASAVAALQHGAADFITKPFDNRQILDLVRRISFRLYAQRKNKQYLEKQKETEIIAIDKKMRDILALVDQVAPTPAPVLIEGASGTGKELIAREIHKRSLLRDKAFLAVNCIALPDALLESELFGYKRGAFTGAHQDTVGLFEQAKGGTVFLDEAASMSASFQGKLLRVLQEKVIRPLGAGKDLPVDFRLIVATNKNLKKLVETGRFREDLYYRIQVVKIELPKLKERSACIPALAEYFLRKSADEFFGTNGEPPRLSPKALDIIRNYNWPGNVRELENAIKRAIIMSDKHLIQQTHLKLEASQQVGNHDMISYDEGKQRAIESFQREYVEQILIRTQGNISKSAELCGLTRAALQRIIRKLDIQCDRRCFEESATKNHG